MDRKRFFDSVRNDPFPGRLGGSQVSGLEAILNAAPPAFPLDWLAYCLATAYHETAHTMQPIEEYGRGAGRAYGKLDPETGRTYYGRGYVQLTWKDNYEKAGKKLLADLVNQPWLALNAALAARIMFEGMQEGWFTGKKLADYFGPGKSDPVNARRIINGTDKAELIAGYHRAFAAALKAAGYTSNVAAAPPSPPPAKIVEATPKASPSVWERFLAGFRSINKGA